MYEGPFDQVLTAGCISITGRMAVEESHSECTLALRSLRAETRNLMMPDQRHPTPEGMLEKGKNPALFQTRHKYSALALQ